MAQNIWNHYWHCVNKSRRKGPYEGQVYFFKGMKLPTGQKNFVAGEFCKF